MRLQLTDCPAMWDHRWCLLPGDGYSAEELEPSLAWQEEVASDWEGSRIPEVRWIPDWRDPRRVAETLASLAAQSVTGFTVRAGVRGEDLRRTPGEFRWFAKDGRAPDAEELADLLGLSGRIRWVDPTEAAEPSGNEAGVILLGPTDVLHPMSLFVMGKELGRSGAAGLMWFLETLSDRETGGPHAVRFHPGPSLYSVFGRPGVSGTLWADRSFWNRYRTERSDWETPLSGGFGGWPFVVSAVEWQVPVRRLPLALAGVETRRQTVPRLDGIPTGVRAALTALAEDRGIRLNRWNFDAARRSGAPVPASADEPLAVVIPFRDQEDLTASTFRSLAAQSAAPRIRLVAVDNGSDPGIAGRLKTLALSLFGAERTHWLKDDAPFNFARLNNRGVASCAEKHLLFLNNDVELERPDAVGRLQSFLGWPGVGMVGGALLYPGGALQAAGIRFGSAGPEVVRDADAFPLAFREVDALTFACAACRREAFESVGGLDESVCPNGFGDALIGHRMKAAGWSVLVDPGVRIIHHESKSRGERPEEIERAELLREGVPLFLYGTEWAGEGQDILQRFGRSRPNWRKRVYRAFRAARKELMG